MTINFYDFQKLHSSELQTEILQHFSKIVAHNAFVEGEFNHQFEKDFAALLKAKECLLLGNGTDALEIALKIHGIGPGDWVAVGGISFFASAEAVYNVGANPILVDVDPETGLIDLNSFLRIKEQKPIKAVIPVHIYGLPAPIESLENLCRDQKIAIIEDAAQAHLAKYREGGMVGSRGNLACFSFYPTKNLGAFGDAGAITFGGDQPQWSDEIKQHRNHGRSPQGHAIIGRNSRCDHMQAAVLYAKLKYLTDWHESRKKIAEQYFEELPSFVRRVPDFYLEFSSWHLFPIQLADLNEKLKLRQFLQDNGIGSSLFYEKSLAQELPLQDCPGESANANAFAEGTLCLPIHPHLTPGEISKICQVIGKFKGA